MISLPSEEIKFLEWHSENSEEDGFQVVSNKKTKKKKKSLVLRPRKRIESGNLPPQKGDYTLNEGISKISSGYNLREKKTPKYKCFP